MTQKTHQSPHPRSHRRERSRRKHRRGMRRSEQMPSGPSPTPEVLGKLNLSLDEASYIVFDIETTGGNPEKNGITEIFAIRWGPSGIIDTFYSMVNPEVPIPPIVRRMTGINNAMVRDAPRIEEVMPRFLAFVQDDVLVSHNTIGDIKFLRYFALKACNYELANFFLCTHLLVERLAPETPDKSLKGLAAYFKLHTGELHRAEADAYVTLELFKVLLGRLSQNSVKKINEAVRIQGDLESGMRLGWGVDPKKLLGLPSKPGIIKLYDYEDRLLFASSTVDLDREFKKIASLAQLPRQLLRLVLKTYDLKYVECVNIFTAMLEESAVLADHKINYDPIQWHQRSVMCLCVTKHKDAFLLDIGPLTEGVVAAFGPIRDRRPFTEFIAQIGSAIGCEAIGQRLAIPDDMKDIVIAYLNRQGSKVREAILRQQKSMKLWFQPQERKRLAKRLHALDQLLAIKEAPKFESTLAKNGILLTPDDKPGSWQMHHLVASKPVKMTPLEGDPRTQLRNGFAAKMRQAISEIPTPQEARPLSKVEATDINAVLWWIYFARGDLRFISYADLSSYESPT